MAGMRPWAEIKASIFAFSKRHRTESVMIVWALVLGIPMLASGAIVLLGGGDQWLLNTMAVLAALSLPPAVYLRLRDWPNAGVKRRPYRPVRLEGHRAASGALRVASWRWGVVGSSASIILLLAGVGTYFAVVPSDPYVRLTAVILLGCVALTTVSYLAVTHPMADRALRRSHAELEAEHPSSTFVVFKSAQVSSEVASADASSKLGLWSDNSFRIVVSFDDENIRVWDQIWGTRHNVATIPWTRVESIRPAIARVRWRFVRAIDLRLYSAPGEPDVGIVLPPARFKWGFRPLPDPEFDALSMKLKTHLARRRGRAASLGG